MFNYKFVDNLPEYLRCSLCGSIFDSPVRIKCSHTFCKACLETWMLDCNQCRDCNKKITLSKTPADLVASSLINELQVLCMVEECNWKGRLEDYKDHSCKISF